MRLPSIGRPRRRSRAEGEHGGVAVTVVAFFVGSSVILGMLAISIDLGNLTYERRQVQNGADATSLALASECAADASNCDPDLVEDLLGANSHDAAGRYNSSRYTPGACARGDADQVGPLDVTDCITVGDIDDLGECPPLPSWLATSTIPYVETYAATQTAKGDNELFLPFSRALVGGASGDAGTSACGRAAWGQVGSSRPSLPLVIGQCNWEIATAGGTRFMVSPPYSPGPNTGASVPDLADQDGTVRQPQDFVTQIFAKLNPSEDLSKFPCKPELENPPGSYGPGGFGWLTTCGTDPGQAGCEGVTNPCYAPIVGNEASSGPGASLPTDCKTVLADFVGMEVDIPVVTGVSGTGSNLTYQVDGVSTFFLAGYEKHPSADPKTFHGYTQTVPEQSCIDSGGLAYKSSCIWGWFTSPVHAAGELDPDVTPRGPVVVQPVG